MKDNYNYCDSCGKEYDKGIKKCPSCGGVVARHGITGPVPQTAELCEIYDESEGALIRAVLEENGIFSFLRVNTMPGSRLILSAFKKRGLYTVIINKEDYFKAKKILKDIRRKNGGKHVKG